MSKAKIVSFTVFHILMKIIPFLLILKVSQSGNYDGHSIFYSAAAVVVGCYAAGSLIWDYFSVKKYKESGSFNIIPMLAVDILLLVFGLVIFIRYFVLVMEIWGYSDFFDFLKFYFITANME